ncbi:GGDEF domain-containing protein [Chitinimonas arctica]|uniref:diguanylate cyclase n=1 Tax=Chitinimonas arctica TaxID=2594795 RepID=A0A516SI76_9NEIS|nr:GGDEF domain-containing protein [Chitinimonas arctica]QDQ27738.1 GGDEF domain-containing protein [Chitinimonas arctica]
MPSNRVMPSKPLQRLLLEGSSLLDTQPAGLLALADEVLEISRTTANQPGEIQAYYWRALAMRHLGDCAGAIETLHRAHALAKATRDQECLVLILLGYARISTVTGLYDAGLQFLYRAAGLGESALPPEHPTLLDIQRGYCIIKSQLGHFVAAIQEFKLLAERYMALGLVRDAVYCINNAGNNCSRMLDYQQALDYYAQAEALLRTHGDWPLLLAVLQTNRATPLWALGREPEALLALQEALPVLMAAGHRSSEVDARTKLGKLYIARGDYEAGEPLLLRALELAAESGFTPIRVEIHEALAAYYKAGKDFAAALAHFEAAVALKGEMSSREASERLDRGQTLIQLETALDEVDEERSKRRATEATNDQLRIMADALAEASRSQNRLVENLRREAQSDPLTGLANRRRLDERLFEEHQRASRYVRPLSLLFLDLDHFKHINDGFSHLTGDAVLRTTALVLNEQLRQCDVIGRFGGEEFVIVLPETAMSDALLVAGKLRAMVAAYNWSSIAVDLAVTISIGVTELSPGETVSAWLARTDAALYRAKHAGRDRVEPG